MRAAPFSAILMSAALCSAASSQHLKNPVKGSTHERLIGAWHLVGISSPDDETAGPSPEGMLIYTRDGHMSVQLMYLKSDNALSNEYVQEGYEASFGTYTIDATSHTLTHHIQGSVTRDMLVGKDLPREFRFSDDGLLIITPANLAEHWSVTWKHY